MSRSYTSLLVFENIFDAVSTSDKEIGRLAESVFEPRIQIVEDDCLTRMGNIQELTYDLRGRIELATGQALTQDRIEYLLSQGQYKVPLRSTNTCVSPGGLCKECFKSYLGYEAAVDVGEFVQIKPLYYAAIDPTPVSPDTLSIPLSREPDEYDDIRIFAKDRPLVQGVDFEIGGDSDAYAIFTGWTPDQGTVIVKYLVESRVPFVSWMADTYSGSLLGIKALPSQRLPLRTLLLAELLPTSLVEYAVDTLKGSEVVPEESVSYLQSVPDKLEKAMFAMALKSIYQTATIG